MRYRTVPGTDMRLSEVGFGTGDNAGLIVRATTQERREAIARAFELGVNYFDTSPDYGKGLSEANLGRAFRDLGMRPYITTKVEIMPGDEQDFAGAVQRSVDASLRRLRTDYVDVLQIHNAPQAERDLSVMGWVPLSVQDFLGPDGCLEGLERVQRQGKARYLGFACEHAQGPAAKQLIDTGKFSLINVWYDLTNPTAAHLPVHRMQVEDDYDGLLDYAYVHGCGTSVIRPLAGGTLTDAAVSGAGRHRYAGGGLSRGGRYQEMVAQARSMAFLSRKGERTLGQAAVRFVLMHPGVTTALGGFSELWQLEEMVAASGTGPLSDEDMARVEMAWRSNFGMGVE